MVSVKLSDFSVISVRNFIHLLILFIMSANLNDMSCGGSTGNSSRAFLYIPINSRSLLSCEFKSLSKSSINTGVSGEM